MRTTAVLAVFICQCLSAQYSWHTTTTTFPPSIPPFIEANVGGNFLASPVSADGGEVRTVVIRTANGISGTRQYQYEHLVGWVGTYDYNANVMRWSGYVVRYYEHDPYYPPSAKIYRKRQSNRILRNWGFGVSVEG